MDPKAKLLFEQIFQTLQKLVGLHRHLLDNVRMERKALVDADLRGIQDATLAKQALIEGIHQAELARLKSVAELSVLLKKPLKDLTLNQLVLGAQAFDMKLADGLRTAQNALTILLQRIIEQNSDNKSLVEKSLEHVNEMKRNILGATVPKSTTYNQQGQKSGGMQGARMISREA